MFRNLIILAIAVGAASTAGWFTINREGDQTMIQINRDEIRSDARRAIDRGREFLDQREQRLAEQSMNRPATGQTVGWNDGYNQRGGYPPIEYSQQNYPAGGYGQQSYPAQSYQKQNYPAQNFPARTFPTQNYPAQNYPAENYPARNYPAQDYIPANSQDPSDARVPYREAGFRYGHEPSLNQHGSRYQP